MRTGPQRSSLWCHWRKKARIDIVQKDHTRNLLFGVMHGHHVFLLGANSVRIILGIVLRTVEPLLGLRRLRMEWTTGRSALCEVLPIKPFQCNVSWLG